MASAEVGNELQRAENHKKQAGDDMNEGEIGVVGEEVVERGKLRGDRIGRRWRRMVAMKDDGDKNDGAADGYGYANEG